METSISINKSISIKDPEPPKAARVREPLKDALCLHAEQTDPLAATPSTWPRLAKALSEIKAATPEVTAELIASRADNYRTHFPTVTISALALAKHWGRCEKPNAHDNRDQRPNSRRYANVDDYSKVGNHNI